MIHRCVKLVSILLSLLELERKKNKQTSKTPNAGPPGRTLSRVLKQQEMALRSIGYKLARVQSSRGLGDITYVIKSSVLFGYRLPQEG